MATKDYTIATLGSHSALQILKGAKDEGFKTLCICLEGREKPYRMFKVADEIITIKNYEEFLQLQDELIEKNCIIIPHASFIAYLGTDAVENFKVPYYGEKDILHYESDRAVEREWLQKAGLKLPMIFDKPEDIDRSVIVKFHGALGGMGYFLANSPEDFAEKIKSHPDEKYVIQEYILGVPIYAHYFQSILNDELEVMSFDKRYESNVDSLGRISARDQMALAQVDPSYVVTGNIPIVLRESLLPKIIDMGERVVAQSKKLVNRGLFGPFCLEMIATPNQEIYTFEISARIVAGTNPFIRGTPYTDLRYDKPVSTGRRIAMEIKQAIEQDRIKEILS
ncbi:formate--phosphoribosylaminoimidazolecarboxamide ligase [Nanoarchaeota archaeon]